MSEEDKPTRISIKMSDEPKRDLMKDTNVERALKRLRILYSFTVIATILNSIAIIIHIVLTR